MTTVAEVLSKLKTKADPKNLPGMARFGMAVGSRLGVSVPEMRKIAKEVGRDHRLALALWKTGIAEARIVAALIDDPGEVASKQMESWVKDLDSWDVCDQVCLSLFDKSPLAWQKIPQWAERDEEFVKRAAFALIAGLAWHDKQAADQSFLDLFPVLNKGANDDRNFVRKAVSWAIRNVGKRNRKLNKAALKLARDIRRMDSKGARWVAADVLRELGSEAVQRRLRLPGSAKD